MSEVVVFSAQVLAEAHMIRDVLQQAGIPARLRNTAMRGAMGEIPNEAWAEVVVAPDQEGPALELIKAARARPVGANRPCAGCGEINPGSFEVCWSCQAELPAG